MPQTSKLYHKGNPLQGIKGWQTQLKKSHPHSPSSSHCQVLPFMPTIIHSSTAALLWPKDNASTPRLAWHPLLPLSSHLSSVSLTGSYFATTVLCNANYQLINLSDLYCSQQQLTICSAPCHIHTLRMSSNALVNMSTKLPSESPIPLPHHVGTPATPAMSPHTIATTLQNNNNINTSLLHQIVNRLLQTITNHETNTTITIKWYKK
jgi:hypothetical protein